MRCRECDNPFTKLRQDLFPCHSFQGYLSTKSTVLPVTTVFRRPERVPAVRGADRGPCYNSDVPRVLMVSSEAAPFAKTGGLADVVGSLPAALEQLGNEVAVVLPRYGSIDLKAARRVWDHLLVHLGPNAFDLSVYQAAAPYPVYLIDEPSLFGSDRKGLYGEGGKDYAANHIRFAVLARAALGVARLMYPTEIFHCHDWQTGLVPAYLRSEER